MATMTAQQIRGELEQAFREAEDHGKGCWCCEPESPMNRGIDSFMYSEALYAVDRYRPGEVLTDETDYSIDALADEATKAALIAARAAIVRVVADRLAGKVVQKAAAA